METQLAPGELILCIDVPIGPAARRSHYLKARDQAGFEWSIASAAVALDLGDDGTVRDVLGQGALNELVLWIGTYAQVAITLNAFYVPNEEVFDR